MSVEQKRKQFRSLIRSFGDRPQRTATVYHYTSAEGLRGIIERGELWLTNAAFVNDRTECRALWQLPDMFAQGELTNSSVREAWKDRIRRHKGVNESGSDEDDRTLYLASFSRAKDSLEQWRAYGAFCIGFDVRRMVGNGFDFCKCVYRDRDIRDWILEKQSVPEWEGGCLEERDKRMAAGELLELAAKKYKSPPYKHEREIRITAHSHHTWRGPFYRYDASMFTKDRPIHFRDHPRYKVPVPYVRFLIPADDGGDPHWYKRKGTEIELKRFRMEEEQRMVRGLLPIQEVRLGPMAHQGEAKLACEILLREKGYDTAPVIASKIPYRAV